MQKIILISVTLVTLLLGIQSFNRTAMTTDKMEAAKNVLNEDLQTCCTDPITGFYRDGKCNTGPQDYGTHVVCAEMTDEFLQFTKSKGNDLSTPIPAYSFPGLKAGDKWCLCALRWREALEAGVAPPVVLESTHRKSLQYVSIEDLEAHVLNKD